MNWTILLVAAVFECVGAVFVEATPGTLSADMIRKLRTPPRRAAARIAACIEAPGSSLPTRRQPAEARCESWRRSGTVRGRSLL